MDCRSFPEAYYARREVPVLDQDLAEFAVHQYAVAAQIQSCRSLQNRVARPEQAWPRNVNMQDCRYCDFAAFCLQGIQPIDGLYRVSGRYAPTEKKKTEIVVDQS
jgi:hypothetical protein